MGRTLGAKNQGTRFAYRIDNEKTRTTTKFTNVASLCQALGVCRATAFKYLGAGKTPCGLRVSRISEPRYQQVERPAVSEHVVDT